MSTGSNVNAAKAEGIPKEGTAARPGESPKAATPASQPPEAQPVAGSVALTVKEQGSGQITHQPRLLLGNRPIGRSDIVISGTIFGNRPISPGALQVDHNFNACGLRPVSTSDIVVSQRGYIMGTRPIAVSLLKVNEFLGNRPIASNELPETQVLMGFLD